MGAATGLGELIGLQTIYIACGLTISGAGLVGGFVLREPDTGAIHL
jgi:hypothetical protein